MCDILLVFYDNLCAEQIYIFAMIWLQRFTAEWMRQLTVHNYFNFSLILTQTCHVTTGDSEYRVVPLFEVWKKKGI